MLQTAQTSAETNTNGGTTNAPLQALRTVTYLIRTYARNVNMPYAIEIDGVVASSFANAPKSVHCVGLPPPPPAPPPHPVFDPSAAQNRKIVVTGVPAGKTVRLYLNSDAHPSYRKNPVYAVTPTARNVEVIICERRGLATQTDTLELVAHPNSTAVDRYHGYLTGITWMKISHKYLPAQVDALIPAGTDAVVANAVRSVFAGLSANNITLNLPGPPPRTIHITLEPSTECSNHIAAGYDFRREALPRVHPAAYVALFKAVIDSGVNTMRITSGWRPMLGSIGHRAGLGLDVDYLGNVELDRTRMYKNEDTWQNVSQEEKSLYTTWRTNKTSSNMSAWKAVLDQNQPEIVKKFRLSLDENRLVKQILDPWYMDLNTLAADTTPGTPNTFISDNDQLHRHHLHITIDEPKITGVPQPS